MRAARLVGVRVGRTLAGLVAAAALAGIDDCEGPEYCEASTSDPGEALLIGFACLGSPLETGPLTARFTFEPNPAAPGDTIRLDASGSTASREARIVGYAWELDDSGDGRADFALDAGEERKLAIALARPRDGTDRRRIGLRVTDSAGATAETFHVLAFTGGQAASTEFAFEPTPANVGQAVRFAAAEGAGSTFSWDFEGDGAFAAPAPDRFAVHTYATPGERRVTLRVTDAAGATWERTRTLAVRPSGADVSAVARAAARFAGTRLRGRLRGAPLPLDLAALRTTGGVATARGVPAEGRLRLRGRGLGPLRRSRFAARLRITARLSDRSVTMRGAALATPRRPGADPVCVRLSVRRRGDGVPRGTLRVIGGRPAGLRARFRVVAGAGALRLRGHVRARPADPRPLPARCRALR